MCNPNNRVEPKLKEKMEKQTDELNIGGKTNENNTIQSREKLHDKNSHYDIYR